MASPWERYAQQPAEQEGPWSKYSSVGSTEESESKPKNEGVLNEIGRGLSHGLQVTLPKSVGEAAKFFGAEDAGQRIIDGANARDTADNRESDYGASRGKWSLRGAVHEAADNSVLSLAPGASGAAAGAGIGAFFGGVGAGPGALIGYGVGSLASLPIFYGSQGQQSYDKIEKAQLAAGATPEAARREARIGGHESGAIEAGGELISDVIPFAKVLKPFVRPAGKVGANVVKDMLFPTIKESAKTLGKVEAGEVGTEMGQQAGEAAVEGMHGAGSGATWDDTSSVILPTALMTLIPGMAGGAARHVQVSKMRSALESDKTDPATRTKLALASVKAMEESSPDMARVFSLYAGDQIQSNAPIKIESDDFYKQYHAEKTGVNQPQRQNAQNNSGQPIDNLQPAPISPVDNTQLDPRTVTADALRALSPTGSLPAPLTKMAADFSAREKTKATGVPHEVIAHPEDPAKFTAVPEPVAQEIAQKTQPATIPNGDGISADDAAMLQGAQDQGIDTSDAHNLTAEKLMGDNAVSHLDAFFEAKKQPEVNHGASAASSDIGMGSTPAVTASPDAIASSTDIVHGHDGRIDAAGDRLAGQPTPGTQQPDAGRTGADNAIANNEGKQLTYTQGNVVEMPVADLALSKDVPQFKHGADGRGITQESRLDGKFDRRLAAPVQVWERLNGDTEVISGRHRLDLAQRSGETTIPVQIHREADGFNADQARMLDVELNVKDGRGKVKDYVAYFKELNPSVEQAKADGLLNTAIGRSAHTIANAGSASLIASHANDAITDQAAVAIAQNAPGNEALQNLGMKHVLDGRSINFSVNVMRAAKAAGFEGGGQSGDLFGFDDSFAKEAEAVSREATKQQNAARQQLASISGASKRPEMAAQGGVNVANPKATQAKIDALKQSISDLDGFATNPEIYRKLREDAGLVRDPVALPPEVTQEPQEEQAFNPDQNDMFGAPAEESRPALELTGQTAEEVAAQERAQAAQESEQRAEASAVKAEQAKRDQEAVGAKIKARTDNADNFQFGESSKDASGPVADLFNQPEKDLASEDRVYLDVPFESKEFAKKSGAKWDSEKKQWFATVIDSGSAKGSIATNLQKFLPEGHSYATAENGKQATESKPTNSQFSANKLFTADKVAEARARMKKKLGSLNSGFDPEMMIDGTTIAGAYIESGVRKFSDYSKAMIADFGDSIKPYLRSFYEGVRHYPGLDTSGMTPAAELDFSQSQKEAVKTEEVKAEEAKTNEANPAVGKVEKQKRNVAPATPGDPVLKNDFGVAHIDGYDNETGEGASGSVKTEFLKDAKAYLTAVQKTLSAIGFAPHTDKKGKAEKPVSVNESGIAGSGDVSLTMAHPGTGLGIYVTIGGSALRGVVPSTKSGVQVMMRIASADDRYGTKNNNRWMPVNLSAHTLAMAIDSAVAMHIKPRAPVNQHEDPKADYADLAHKAGKAAFLAGTPRFTPDIGSVEYKAYSDPSMEYDVDSQRNWYNGWDAANLSAPIESAETKAQNEVTGGTQNARPTQTESVPTGNNQADHVGESGGRGAREHLDAGLAKESGSADSGGRVSGSVQEPGGAGQAGGSATVQSSIELGETGSAGNDGHMPDGGLDHAITEEDALGGGIAKRYRDNVAAIKVLKALDTEGRAATPDERKALSRYAGFGGMASMFDPQNKQTAKQHNELRELLTDAEFESARASINNAYYTSKPIVDAMYSAADHFGFKHGRILEPSVGSGNFFGMMPAAMRNVSSIHGVELDLITSKLAQAIYPKAKIAVATGFQDYQVPAGFFDMAIGNPPFGNEGVPTTERTAYSKFSIHNYFIARMIDKVRDGGIVPVIVSHSFMDSLDPSARQWIAERANLIGAARLPSTAFKETAGTEVITDILFFQKTATPDANPLWVNSSDTQIANAKTGETVRASVNNYFQRKPANVLGKVSTVSSQYGHKYTVESNGDLKAQLAGFISSMPEAIYAPIERATDELDSVDNTIPDGIKQGSYFVDAKGNVKQRGSDIAGNQTSNAWQPKNEIAVQRMKGMIGLRDLLRAQMRMERSPDANAKDIEKGRKALDSAYDAFQKKFGFVNSQVNRSIFMDDTESPLLQSIEFNYDKGTSKAVALANDMEERTPSATKADILKRRVLFPSVEKMNVETAKDALLASLDEKGKVDLAYMERAYGKTQDEIIKELGDVIYHDPATDDHIMADEYLSGDVKTKLAEAKKAAQENHAYQRNVDALEKIIPSDKLPSEIFASLGAGWIPGETFNEFAKEVTGSSKTNLSYVPATAQWLGEIGDSGDIGKMRSDFGTDKMHSFDLLKLLMNGRAPEIKMRIMRDGREAYVTDTEATEAAREKASKIKEVWESWVWKDGARSEKLAAIFNDKHNRTIGRSFDGSHLVLHGMNPALTMRTHQKSAIWRMVQDRNTLLDHVVGAGKTFAMTGAIMEMKRLGIARKPLLVVPNHLTLQWRTEFAKMYPAGNVLAATPEDFSKGNRERMFSKIALGDYDAVIIGHSSLTKIGLDPAIEADIHGEQLKEITDAIEDAKRERGDRGIIGAMEKIKTNLEKKMSDLAKKAGTKDKVVTFEELGVDGLFVDEMHEFKNLFFVTQMQRVSGLGNPTGSGKAFDMFAKIRWLQKTYGENAPLITATGTPVSNSLAEMYTMQRYMKYDELKSEGLHLFDAWARMYGEVESLYEVAPSGVGYRVSQRFSKFKNLPSLMANYRSFADTVTMGDLKEQAAAEGKVFPVPNIAGGKPQNIIAKRSQLQTDFFGVPHLKRDEAGNPVFTMDYSKAKIEQNKDGQWVVSDGHSSVTKATREDAELELVEKSLSPALDLDPESLLGKFANLAQLTRASKGKINALSLTGLASKSGLDMRILNPSAPDFEGSKINLAVAEMVRLYKKHGKDKGTQLVFCDLSIPLSARTALASKERRLYVRDDQGLITHKKGAINTVDGYEGFPFYTVRSGKGADARTSIYEPVSGMLVKTGLHTKADAKAWVADNLQKESVRDKWFELRESYPAITQEEIGEYRDAKDLDFEEDGSNEISLEDLESVSGASQFSVYDDIKEKLMKSGVPEREIAFIHDFDSPSKKNDLFKRVKSGDVRFLLGSTPKLGAGTNVQDRIVGLHHIDAPWRPSDLEQREGRGIRQGNKLAFDEDGNRIPGFELFIGRYATEQTYDTRRWQLLEHKASGIEQLRKYSGQAEIDDVAGEASNSADMKAAASGNPLILEETKLANDVKRLNALRKGHADSVFAMQRKLSHDKNMVSSFIPHQIAILEGEIESAGKHPAKYGKDGIGSIVVARKEIKTRDAAEKAIADLVVNVKVGMTQSGKIEYRGVAFEIKQGFSNTLSLSTDLGEIGSYGVSEAVSPSGMITRFENYIDSLPARKEKQESNLSKAKTDIESMESRINAPFDGQAQLERTQAQHASIKRRLMKSTQMEAVPANERAAFEREIAARKAGLEQVGYGKALAELDASSEQPVFSHEESSPIPESEWLSDGAIAQIVEDRISQFKHQPKILIRGRVFDILGNSSGNRNSIPGGAVDSSNNPGVVSGMVHAGKIHLFKEGMGSASAVTRTLWHELLHYGIRRFMTKEQYIASMQKLYSRDAWIKEKADAWVSTPDADEAKKSGMAYARARGVDEALADIAEKNAGENINNGMIAKTIRSVTTWVADLADRFGFADAATKLRGVSSVEAKEFVSSVFGKLRNDEQAVSDKWDFDADPAFSRQQPIGLNTPAQPGSSIPDETEFQKRQRQVQDKMNRFDVLQKFLKDKGVSLSEKANVHENENLMHAKIANQTQDFRDHIETPLLERAAKSGFTLSDIADYLEAQHIPEANARMRDIHHDATATANGITDAEANQALAEFQGMPKFAEFKKIADEFQSIGEETLNLRLREGLISRDQYDAYKGTYQHWVPLRGDGKKAGVGKGLSVNAKEKRRLGHGQREDGEKIIENLLMDRERAIYQVEHNRVGKSIIQFALEAKEPDMITVGKPEKRQMLKDQNVFAVQYKGQVVRSFSAEADAKSFIAQAVALSTSRPGGGMARSNFAIAKSNDPIVVMQASPMLAENEIQVYVAGHTIRVQLNDELLARAATNMGVDQVNSLLSAGRTINNGLSKVYTAYSPDFIFRNAIRDFIAGTINLTGDMGVKMAAKIYANYGRAAKELFIARNDPRKSAWVQRYRAAGGNTGAAYLSDIERIGADAQAAMHERMKTMEVYHTVHDKLISEGRNQVYAHTAAAMKTSIAKFSAIPVLGHFLSLIEHLNAVTENALRLATYMTLVQNGYTEQKSAVASKNSTVNFNRKGEISNVMGAAYLFFNPSVQGSTRMFSSLLKSEHKGQAQAMAGMLAFAAFALAELGRGGDDDDDRKWKNIPDQLKDHNMIFKFGDLQWTIPVPYEFAPFHVLGNAISDVNHGESAWKASMKVLGSLVDNLSPIGDPFTGNTKDGANYFQLMPTVVKMGLAPHENQNSFAAPIQPEKNSFSKNKPDSQNMFRNTAGTFYSGAAEWVNEMTGGSKYKAGGVDVSPEVLKFWVSSLTGGTGRFVVDMGSAAYGATQGVAPDLRSTPIARVFVREPSVSDSRAKFWEIANEVKVAADELSMAKKDHNGSAVKEIRDSEGDMIRLSKFADKMGKAASKKRDAIDAIRQDDQMPLDQKREQMKAIEQKEQEYYDRFLKMFDQKEKARRDRAA